MLPRAPRKNSRSFDQILDSSSTSASSILQIEIVTLFPEIFDQFFSLGLIGKAAQKELLQFKLTQLRDFSYLPHFRVDDTPYGGGPGMLLTPGPVVKAVRQAKRSLPLAKSILLSPAGKRFNQKAASDLSKLDQLIFICPRYEGLDQRAITDSKLFTSNIPLVTLLLWVANYRA